MVGLENHTSFIHAVREGVLRATARPLTRGRRTQVWEGEIRDAGGRIVATGRVRLLCLEPGSELAGTRIEGKPQRLMAAKPIRKTEAWSLAVVTTLAMSISYVDRQTLAVLAPTITKALHISDVGYGWLGAAFSLAYLAAGPFAGVSDRSRSVGAP